MDPFLLFKMQLPQLALTTEDIAFATANDQELKNLRRNLRPDSNKNGNYSIHDGCILICTRVWIPSILRNHILEYLHIEHVGIIKMMALAYSYRVYWPSIDEDIKELAGNCLHCIEIRLTPRRVLVHSWVVPKEPWEKIHIDYAGPFMNNLFLLVVDEYSMWLEVFILNSSSALNTIKKLKPLFSKFGRPRVLVSDTINPFMEKKFQSFLKSFGIEHCTCVPHNAASYDNVVRFVIALKHALIELKGQDGSVQDKLNTLLSTYRSSQITSTIKKPTKLFLGRELRSNLDPLKPSSICDKVNKKRPNKKDATPSKLFHHGQKVVVYNKVNGIIINVDASKYVSVLVNGRLIRRHIDKVIPFPDIKSASNIQTVSDTPPVQSQRPKRTIKLIDRLNYS